MPDAWRVGTAAKHTPAPRADSSEAARRAVASQRGASSVRKIASPTESGTASTRAISEVSTVPTMKGSAPNSPSTGFQCEVLTKLPEESACACAEVLDGLPMEHLP